MLYYRDAFSCSNGKCIDSSLACDGHADCSDSSDETQSLCSQLFTKYRIYTWKLTFYSIQLTFSKL